MVTILKLVHLKDKAKLQRFSKLDKRTEQFAYELLRRELDFKNKELIDHVDFELEEESKIDQLLINRRVPPMRNCKKKTSPPVQNKRKSKKLLSFSPRTKHNVKRNNSNYFHLTPSLDSLLLTPEEIREKVNPNIFWLTKLMNPVNNGLTTTIERSQDTDDETCENDDDNTLNDQVGEPSLPFVLPENRNDIVDLSGRDDSYNDPTKPEGFYSFGFECVRRKQQKNIAKIRKYKASAKMNKQVIPKVENEDLITLYEAKIDNNNPTTTLNEVNRRDYKIGNTSVHIRIQPPPIVKPCSCCKVQFIKPIDAMKHKCDFASLHYSTLG